MENSIKIALINTILIISILPVLGYIIDFIISKLSKVLCKIVGVKTTIFILDRLTFIGTIHHELSHALFALCTGAKVTKVELFKPDKNTGTLGKVKFKPRGPWVIKSIQMCLTSIAPMICGSLSIYLLIYIIIKYNLQAVALGIALYLMISILIHMQMSKQDIKNCKSGAPICIGILFLVIWISKLNIFDLITTLSQNL